MIESIDLEIALNCIKSVIVIAVSLLFWFTADRLFRRWSKKGVEDERKAVQRRVAKNIHASLKYILIFITLMIVLQINGIEVGPMAASLGIAGIVVGFALQTALEDVIMGIHVVTDGFYRIGDVIEYNNVHGEVISTTPQTTKIRSITDNSIIAVSNRNLHEVTKAARFITIDVPISFRTDPEQAESILLRSCERAPQVIDVIASCRYAFIDEYAGAAAVHKIVVESNPRDRVAAQRAMRSLVIKDLAAEGIVLADNTMIDVRRGDLPSAGAAAGVAAGAGAADSDAGAATATDAETA